MSKIDVIRTGSPRLLLECFPPHGPGPKELVGHILAEAEIQKVKRASAARAAKQPKTPKRSKPTKQQQLERARSETRRLLSTRTPMSRTYTPLSSGSGSGSGSGGATPRNSEPSSASSDGGGDSPSLSRRVSHEDEEVARLTGAAESAEPALCA